jgi:hypothetical protein
MSLHKLNDAGLSDFEEHLIRTCDCASLQVDWRQQKPRLVSEQPYEAVSNHEQSRSTMPSNRSQALRGFKVLVADMHHLLTGRTTVPDYGLLLLKSEVLLAFPLILVIQMWRLYYFVSSTCPGHVWSFLVESIPKKSGGKSGITEYSGLHADLKWGSQSRLS